MQKAQAILAACAAGGHGTPVGEAALEPSSAAGSAARPGVCILTEPTGPGPDDLYRADLLRGAGPTRAEER